MKYQMVLLGVLIGLTPQAGSKPSQGATTNQSAAETRQSLTGCMDEQNGQYVLLDNQMQKIVGLQSAGSDREVFAKYVGRKVQVSGTRSSGQQSVFKVTSIEQVSSTCGKAK
jgi:hypothetical protein